MAPETVPFVPYQVDYSVKNVSKMIGFSKKRVQFKFGFANPKSLADGLTGPACRGSEHELVFIWSLTSGKRQLLLDNKDMHFSESGQNGWTSDRTFQHTFTFKDAAGRRTYTAHFVSDVVRPEDVDARPFDLRIGGISYFNFNPIYTLGTDRMISGREERPISPMNAEERKALAAAKLASLRDLEQQQEKQKQTEPPKEAALISFDDDPPPPPPMPNAVQATQPVTSSGSYYRTSSITLDPSFEEQRQPGATVFGSNPYAAAPPQTNQQPYPNQPYTSPASQYGAPPPPPPQSNVSTTALAPYGGAPQQQQQQTYVDATGRVNVGQSPYSNYSLPSPSNQSFVSYGSAPSFAQPPQQPGYAQAPAFAQPQQQPAYPPQQSYPPQPSYPPQANPNYAHQPYNPTF